MNHALQFSLASRNEVVSPLASVFTTKALKKLTTTVF